MWVPTYQHKMPNYIGLSFYIWAKRIMSSCTNTQCCPLPETRSHAWWTTSLHLIISVSLLPLLIQAAHFHQSKKFNLVFLNNASMSFPAFLLIAGITKPAPSPTANTPDLATSRTWGRAAQAELCHVLKLEEFGMGLLHPLCPDPPWASWY